MLCSIVSCGVLGDKVERDDLVDQGAHPLEPPQGGPASSTATLALPWSLPRTTLLQVHMHSNLPEEGLRVVLLP